MENQSNTFQVQLRLPPELVSQIDEVKDPELSRSAWIRGAIRLRVQEVASTKKEK